MGADKKSAVTDLMEQGKLKGKLTTKEITDALEELDFDVEQMDKLYDSLESLNIEIIEDYNPEQDLDLNLNLEEVLEEVEDDSVLTADGINIDDPVKVYLKDVYKRQGVDRLAFLRDADGAAAQGLHLLLIAFVCQGNCVSGIQFVNVFSLGNQREKRAYRFGTEGDAAFLSHNFQVAAAEDDFSTVLLF